MLHLFIFVIAITFSLGQDLYSFTVKDWQGNDVSLEKYRGKVKLFRNTLQINHTIFYRTILGLTSCQCE